MNRRQFLTGVSAAAVASALPAAPALSLGGVPIIFDEGVIEGCSYHILPQGFALSPDWRSFCATGEKLG